MYFSKGISQDKNIKLIYLIMLCKYQNVFSEGSGSYTSKCGWLGRFIGVFKFLLFV